MSDNGTYAILADTLNHGYSFKIKDNSAFAKIDPLSSTQAGWLGATRIDFSDTFFIANSPKTPSFYVSGSEDITFDGIDFAGKSGKPDNIITLIVNHRLLWLIGEYTTEIWYNSGGDGTISGSFPFQAYPGAFIDFGIIAPYSLAKTVDQIFWLARDITGKGIVVTGLGNKATRISSHAIEYAINQMVDITDAVGFVYQQEGHEIYQLTFPSANKTFCFSIQYNIWFEKCWLDANGDEQRHRAQWHTYFNGYNLITDWENGHIYTFDLNTYTDNGKPIKRLHTFPHSVEPNHGHSVVYDSFIADMEVGNALPSVAATPTVVTTISSTLTICPTLSAVCSEYIPQLVNFPTNYDHTQTHQNVVDSCAMSPTLAGFPSTFSSFTLSLWICCHTPASPSYDILQVLGNTAFDDGIHYVDYSPVFGSQCGVLITTNSVHTSNYVGPLVHIQVYSVDYSINTDGSHNHLAFDGYYTIPGNENMGSNKICSTNPTLAMDHLLISFTSVGLPDCQVYANDIQLVYTGVWNSKPTPWNLGIYSKLVNNQGNWWVGPVRSGVGDYGDIASFGDYWLDNRFINLTDESNRRKFITTDKTPVSLGTNGQIPTGSSPKIFLSTSKTGSINDFLSNKGTGGSWTQNEYYMMTWTYSLATSPNWIQTDLGYILATTNSSISTLASLVVNCSCVHCTPISPADCTITTISTTTIVAGTPGIQQDNTIRLSYSHDRGRSFKTPIYKSLGETGEYSTSLKWARLGMARDAVFQLEWSANCRTALTGAWIEYHSGRS
jgi:hypothetical protein